MPRKSGARNYKNDLLIQIVAQILPNGEYSWQAVAMAYQEQSKEASIRDTDDLKRHWTKNLCNSMKKPTGKPGEKNDRILRCIAIEREIMKKTHAGMMGIDESKGEDEEEVAEGGEEDNVPRRSPSRVAKTRANDFIRTQLASTRVPTAEVAHDSAEEDAHVIAGWERRGEEEEDPDYEARVDCPPTPIVAAYTRINAREADGEFVESSSPKTPPAISQSVRTALERAAETTPPLGKSVSNAMARASSLAKAGKTKNSSNKSRERTSIAGTIVNMLERMDSSSSGGDMTVAMNMMMMRQMDAMTRSMDRRDKEERARERKRRRKRRARREAKRRLLEASFGKLDDHGGKHSGIFSDSSDSSSISTDGGSDQDSGYGKGQWQQQTVALGALGVQEIAKNDEATKGGDVVEVD